ncbi:hypothetical protein K491DRAFT_153618 [Lophiostoma macrostomum CBS 122681]|uniref:Uncharacterized protein n=1 Tax=Lophiostoma macrostomum CBS 122681 TaxID=1314788 RepID=A0A6A6TLB7_9PLEO|nr:hypothetical protein K491DRAFT_153618 [Lophiostoma macrostomum CBS 122681]
MPNMRGLQFENARFQQTPLYRELCKFWRELDFERYETLLSYPGPRYVSPIRWEWISSVLEVVPSAVNELTFPISAPTDPDIWNGTMDGFRDLVDRRDEEASLSALHLVLHLPPYEMGILPSNCSLLNYFGSLKRLSLTVHGSTRPVDGIFPPCQLARRTFYEIFLPRLQHLNLSGWIFWHDSLGSMHHMFPAMQSLKVSDLTLTTTAKYDLDSYLWYYGLQTLGQNYGGRCRIEFGNGQIAEGHGSFLPNMVSMSENLRGCILKQPALDLLVSVFQSRYPMDELYYQYQAVTTPEWLNTVVSQIHDQLSPQIERVKIVETSGATHLYDTGR